jgi:GNAT superfamily N-acetyltransferase
VPTELDLVEAAAFRDVYEAGPPTLSERHGFAVAVIGRAVCGAAHALAGVRDLNRVVGADAGTDLDAVLDFYDGLEHIVAESPGADGLRGKLLERGYTATYAWRKFVRPADSEASARTDLRLETVGPDRAHDFAEPVREGFGMPAFMEGFRAFLPGRAGWTCIVGYEGDEPVSAGALYVDGDVGWLGMGATKPEARGHGGQSAILAARIRLAAEAGCTTVTTETGVREPGMPERSYRNILRSGFEEAYVRPNWASPAGVDAA